MTDSGDKVWAIVGPTASGKSALAMALAEEHRGEIIGCDSVQVYRGFDIGSGKASADDRAWVVHHLVDVAEWSDRFDAGEYVRACEVALAQVRSRGKRPIVCGGTGLYLRALRWGLIDLPPKDPEAKTRLEAEEASDPGCLFSRLQEVDPETASRTDPNNLVYVVRALEIFESTGRRASEIRAEHGFARERVPMTVVALNWDREVLRAKIRARADDMLAEGLLDEVDGLLKRGVAPDCRPMRAVGYAQAAEVVLGHKPEAGLADRIGFETARYAKRQRTWLRREANITFIEGNQEPEALARSAFEVLQT